ncbi:succinate dehydrogenase assembly factor 2 [Ehrlichia ruminantium]|uniref:FAD assembly factor SdhE n=2 Tax=Ehrlichia ruminantium TaxID=779 RepID=A0AAE6QBI7_EHRRU|nr:succinate dehydrogenase assembly factor 2 [Ehrlichia ruminantium]QGR03008.1 succinate dehydrogenase assembly factor 2 [Ehrlichia ruminantium]QGR03933.1 succinate dehydrogenase assembly factor 2 [Ehrlichia ruminantium]QGR04855.1 succinate dehydrogenase assembly factor 2 [Ehrlichia ruminantium]
MDTLLEKRKRLLYRSLHRGCKEMDIILGNFALHHIYLLSNEDVDEYEKVVNTSDYQLYKYITGEELIPECLDRNLVRNIVDFNESIVKLKFSK